MAFQLSQYQIEFSPAAKLSNTYLPFSSGIQMILNVLTFFLIWPSINLLGNSITFYIFIILILNLGSFWIQSGIGKNLFLIFGGIVLLSAFFTPYQVMPRHLGFQSVLIITLQWVYWILLTIFYIVNRNRLNYLDLTKWIFYGTIAASIGFYLVKFKLDLGVVEFKTNLSRNSYVFTLLVAIPACIYYLKQKAKAVYLPYILVLFLLLMMLTNGRSGGLIILIEMILILSILYTGFQKTARFIFVFLGLLFFLNEANALDPIKEFTANQVSVINPRLASLIRGEEEGDKDGDLTFDKSWLLRILMVQKGIEIVKEYPVLGIGPNNFSTYDAKLEGLAEIERLGNRDKEFMNSRSAHNSYVQIMSEFGLLGFAFVIIILFVPIVFFLKKFATTNLQQQDLFLISIIGAGMHFYAINTITGAIAWMFIGLAWVCLSYQKIKWINLSK